MREARAVARDASRESTCAKHIYARHGKMNKRCLFTVFTFKNISSDSTLNPKFYIYISYQAGKQASKQAGAHLACLLAQIGPFSLLACLINNQASKPS